MHTVVAPEAAGLCVTSKVKGREFDITDRELFRGRMEGRLTGNKLSACILRHQLIVVLQNCHPVILEHVKKPACISCCFPGISDALTWSFRHCLCIHVSFES